jgi:hypothetical protein
MSENIKMGSIEKPLDLNNPDDFEKIIKREKKIADREAGTPPEKYRDNPGPGDPQIKFEIDQRLWAIKESKNPEKAVENILNELDDLARVHMRGSNINTEEECIKDGQQEISLS